MRGIYILAYMGKIIYVGKATTGVALRLEGHWRKRGQELLGTWMAQMEWDWCNVRVDVLEPPDDHSSYWIEETEAHLVKKFNPLFNMVLGGDKPRPFEG